ncbi:MULTISPECIES: antibiotic biosynthesis monooxygenase family protein [unclassified Streptomyces]|uniref:antibiotic biosynthesis monooxygenase family protein n=1 Tax=unclassified Streptomyces TaxID=2593676 RepID=UPI0033E10A5B
MSTSPTTSPTKTRVVLRIQLHEGMGDQYAAAYHLVHSDIAKADGFISSQLCKSVKDPDCWIVTSEWASMEQYLAFVASEEFTARRAGMRKCVLEHDSSQYSVMAE